MTLSPLRSRFCPQPLLIQRFCASSDAIPMIPKDHTRRVYPQNYSSVNPQRCSALNHRRRVPLIAARGGECVWADCRSGCVSIPGRGGRRPSTRLQCIRSVSSCVCRQSNVTPDFGFRLSHVLLCCSGEDERCLGFAFEMRFSRERQVVRLRTGGRRIWAGSVPVWRQATAAAQPAAPSRGRGTAGRRAVCRRTSRFRIRR
jgi:hypothetical protein